MCVSAVGLIALFDGNGVGVGGGGCRGACLAIEFKGYVSCVRCNDSTVIFILQIMVVTCCN